MNYFSGTCQFSIRLIDNLNSLDTQNKLDFELINKSIYWAKKYHDGQFRKSGEPFYSHPLEVAYMVSEHLLKTDVIVASILHDIVEDTEVTIERILNNFGCRIAEMVDRLTSDRPDGSKWSIEKVLNNAYNKGDKEVLLIKVIDRLHNILNMQNISVNKQISIAQETLNTLLPICTYLEDINTEFMIGSVINKILCYQEKGTLLNYKTTNPLLNSIYRNHFIDLFKP